MIIWKTDLININGNDGSFYYTVDYVLDGSKIIKETYYGDLLRTDVYYFYDAAGSVAGMEYNGSKFYYVKNLQGDIVRIVDSTGTTVVTYVYDAWGKVLSTTGTMATLGEMNPFRYRGYYYDIETGWYYLNSRYYDPDVGRFINADGIVGANGGILGYNMYAYCNNNPVMFVDPTGYCQIMVINNAGTNILTIPCGTFTITDYPNSYIDFGNCDKIMEINLLVGLISQWEGNGKPTLNLFTDLEGGKSIGFSHKMQTKDNKYYDPNVYKVTGSHYPASITEEQAWRLLYYDINTKIKAVESNLAYYKLDWNFNQILSVASIAYNHGGSSDMIKWIRDSNDLYNTFITAYTGYRDSKGVYHAGRPNIIARRSIEYKIFVYGVWYE